MTWSCSGSTLDEVKKQAGGSKVHYAVKANRLSTSIPSVGESIADPGDLRQVRVDEVVVVEPSSLEEDLASPGRVPSCPSSKSTMWARRTSGR